MAIFLAFIAACLWGVADYIGGIQSKRMHFSIVTIIREATCILIYLAVLPFMTAVFHWSDFVIGLAVGVLCGAALPVFFGLLASGRMSLVAPVAGTVGAAVPILIGVASGERPSILQSCGLLLAVLAIAFVSVEHRHDEELGRQRHFEVRDITVAALCGIAFGVFYAAMHHTTDDSGFWPLAGVSLSMVAVLAIWNAGKQPAVMKQLASPMLGWVALGGAIECGAAILYMVATRQGFLSITAAVSSLYPVGTALLAGYLLKEKLSRVNAFGLLLCAGGLAFIAS